jgi:mRNA interferase MazF
VAVAYVPEAGDIVWLQFSPQALHEQSGLRPALVLSPSSYNGKTGLVVCCPLTTKIKGCPFEVPAGTKPSSVVLSDQLKSIDWRARGAVRKGKIPSAELALVRANARSLIGA